MDRNASNSPVFATLRGNPEIETKVEDLVGIPTKLWERALRKTSEHAGPKEKLVRRSEHYETAWINVRVSTAKRCWAIPGTLREIVVGMHH